MPEDQHPLERRATALADAFTKRVDLMASMMRPDNTPVFHTKLSDAKALDFWQKHRYDSLGQAVLSTWSPAQIMNLDTKLSQMHLDQQGGLNYGPPAA